MGEKGITFLHSLMSNIIGTIIMDLWPHGYVGIYWSF